LAGLRSKQRNLQPFQTAPQQSQWSAAVDEEVDELEAVLNQSFGTQASTANQDCDGDEEQFWEDAVQAEQDNASVATPQKAKTVTSVGSAERCSQQSGRSPNGSPGSVMASQMSQSLEMALEEIIDEALQ